MNNIDPKSFCYFPFVHANIRANYNRKVSPCWRSDEVLGNLDNSSLEEIWNGPAYTELRQKFLNGEKPEGCARCWKHENNNTGSKSLRQLYLNNYEKYHDTISLTKPEIKSIEIRFSNLCNFSCLHCGSEHSSSWTNKLKKSPGIVSSRFIKLKDKNPRIISESDVDTKIIPILNTLDEVRITGGEPLTDPVFYYFLERVPTEIAKNIELLIVTNLSKLNYENKNGKELFKKFKKVNLRVSLDADPSTFEYFRSGSDFQEIDKNIKTVKDIKNVELSAVCAVNILNITRIKNIFKYVEKNNIKLKIIYVDRPFALDIRNLPDRIKDTMSKVKLMGLTFDNQQSYREIVKFMNSRKREVKEWNYLKTYLNQIDELNGTSFISYYPEFKTILREK